MYQLNVLFPNHRSIPCKRFANRADGLMALGRQNESDRGKPCIWVLRKRG